MTPQPDPQPEPEKAKPQANPASKPSSAPSSSGASPAEAYIPRPGQAPGKGRGILVLAALIAAGALAGTAVHFRTPAAPSPIVAAAAKESKILTVTDADINVAATELIRKSVEAPAPVLGAPAAAAVSVAVGAAGSMGSGAAGQSPGAPIQQAPAPAIQTAPPPPGAAPASSPLPTAPPELVAPAPAAPHSIMTPQARQAVRSDGFSIFSMKLVDDMDQDGDVVQILIDGVPMSYLSLTHAGATLEIPLKKGESHKITVLAVRDGVGGVTLGLQTSAGMIVSRRMLVGESDSWTLDYK